MLISANPRGAKPDPHHFEMHHHPVSRLRRRNPKRLPLKLAAISVIVPAKAEPGQGLTAQLTGC
jgi:hypothetical protein